MPKKDSEIVDKVVRKVMEDFDFDIDDILESKKEDIEQSVKDGVMDYIDKEPPSIDWIEMVELDRAEEHKNNNGDFLSS